LKINKNSEDNVLGKIVKLAQTKALGV